MRLYGNDGLSRFVIMGLLSLTALCHLDSGFAYRMAWHSHWLHGLGMLRIECVGVFGGESRSGKGVNCRLIGFMVMAFSSG